MKISMQTMAIDSFVPVLRSLSGILDTGAAHAKAANLDLVGARLAPDMYTLAQQVQIACNQAKDCVARLTGQPLPSFEDNEQTFDDLKARIAKTIDAVESAGTADFESAEDRDCSINIPDGRVISMNGLQYLTAWALPQFYFHVVTAYGILRHNGVAIGKKDYASHVGVFIRSRE